MMVPALRLHRSQLPAAVVWLLVCLVVTVRAKCDKPCFENHEFPVVLPKGLDAKMFNRYACLIDPSLDCRLSHEFSGSSRPSAAEKGFPANAWSGTVFCPACDIYFEHCTKSDGSMNTGTLQFVHTNTKATSTSGHALVMPNQPCRGVEVWENGRCGGEKAWDAAFKRWTDDGGKAKDYFGFVMAVNSMRRRTRSQLHLHVGILAPGVKTGLQAGHTWAKAQKKSSFLIACSTKTPPAITCKFDSNKQKPSENTIAVSIKSGSTPAEAKPFNTVYGPNAQGGAAPSDATINDSMGVVASADKEWLLLQMLDGAAECLMADTVLTGSQDKCSVAQPKARQAASDEAVAAADDDDDDAAAAAADPAVGDVTAAAASAVDPAVVDATVATAVEDGSVSASVPGRRLKL